MLVTVLMGSTFDTQRSSEVSDRAITHPLKVRIERKIKLTDKKPKLLSPGAIIYGGQLEIYHRKTLDT